MKISALIAHLQEYGITKEQSLVYLTLCERGPKRINELMKLTSLPRSSVYEHIASLSEYGLIKEQRKENHRLFAGLPFDSIRHTLQTEQKKLQELDGKVDDIQKLIGLHTKYQHQATQVNYYDGVAGARQLLWNTLHATETVFVYSSWGRSRYVGTTFYERFVTESKARAVKEKVLVNDNPATIQKIREGLQDPTSRTRLTDIHALKQSEVKIAGETFIYNQAYAQLYLKEDGVITGFEIISPYFTATQRSIFEFLWKQAIAI